MTKAYSTETRKFRTTLLLGDATEALAVDDGWQRCCCTAHERELFAMKE